VFRHRAFALSKVMGLDEHCIRGSDGSERRAGAVGVRETETLVGKADPATTNRKVDWG
jgi:hypothetical protein